MTKKIQTAQNLVSVDNETSFAHIPCLVHGLQLSILHAFKTTDTETLLVKYREIIGCFKHNPIHTN